MRTPSGNEDAVGITDTFTISVWLKNEDLTPTGSDTWYSIRATGTDANSIDLKCALNSNNNVDLDVTDASLSLRQNRKWSAIIKGGASAMWRHIVVTWGGDTGTGVDGFHLYADGIDQGVGTDTADLDGSGMTDTDRAIRVGGRIVTDDEWTGPIYSAALWDKVLNPTEIAGLYNGGNARDFDLQSDGGGYASSANLIHYNRLDGLGGTTDVEFGRDRAETGVVPPALGLSLEGNGTTPDDTDLTTDIPI